MAESAVRTVPAADVPWDDVRLVFQTRGDPARCWCQFFKLNGAEWRATSSADRQARLSEQIRDGSPGLIAYLDGVAVGWCAVEPRPHYPGLLRSRVVVGGSTENPVDDTVWAITCFVVRSEFRRRGVATALVRAAVNYAEARGASVIEGYPVDAAEREATASVLYHGTVSLFEGAGFEVGSRPSRGRAVMRLPIRD
jgi:ribosomal protein S18 acetylase RimI-like enzyme